MRDLDDYNSNRRIIVADSKTVSYDDFSYYFSKFFNQEISFF